jgi:hypothetical protein
MEFAILFPSPILMEFAMCYQWQLGISSFIQLWFEFPDDTTAAQSTAHHAPSAQNFFVLFTHIRTFFNFLT